MVVTTIIITIISTNNSFCQKHNTITSDSIINKWCHAIINIEARNGDIGSSGTAIYLEYKKEKYLLSARHVFENPSKPGFLSDVFLLVENFTERNKDTVMYDSHANFTFTGDEVTMLQFYAGGRNYTNFIFSQKDTDLALIHLKKNDFIESGFIHTLDKRGYKPIFISDIDTICKIKSDQTIFAFGFPEEADVFRYPNSPALLWKSQSVSIPVVSIGKIQNDFNSSFFTAEISVYHGYSGGPIVMKNKLIGIVHGPNPILVKMKTKSTPYYLSQNLLFIKSSLILPLLKKMVSENR
jgi:hypothetical protein